MLLPSGVHEGSSSTTASVAIGVKVNVERSGADAAGIGVDARHIQTPAPPSRIPTTTAPAATAGTCALRRERAGAAGGATDALVASDNRSRICRSSRYRSRVES